MQPNLNKQALVDKLKQAAGTARKAREQAATLSSMAQAAQFSGYSPLPPGEATPLQTQRKP
jgi:hypothetical protein